MPVGNASIEHRQFDQVVVRHWFHRLPCLSPGAQSAGDHEDLEPFFDQYLRHPGARGFACSSTVEINLPLLGKVLDLFFEQVGFEANRPGDALRLSVVVPVAADVGDQNAAGFGRSEAAAYFLSSHSRSHVQQPVAAIDDDAIDNVNGKADAEDGLSGRTGGAQPARDVSQHVAEEIACDRIGADINEAPSESKVRNCVGRMRMLPASGGDMVLIPGMNFANNRVNLPRR